MRKMMGKVGREHWNCRCCCARIPNKTIRKREKNGWLKDQ